MEMNEIIALIVAIVMAVIAFVVMTENWVLLAIVFVFAVINLLIAMYGGSTGDGW